mmetsp:Transcript_49233/g.96305  ORF Transcript_49233/g.96305 Transcript_49233/m.96305 type:complete len:134 (-) Transcript_49233:369-770(-)
MTLHSLQNTAPGGLKLPTWSFQIQRARGAASTLPSTSSRDSTRSSSPGSRQLTKNNAMRVITRIGKYVAQGHLLGSFGSTNTPMSALTTIIKGTVIKAQKGQQGPTTMRGLPSRVSKRTNISPILLLAQQQHA